MKIVEWLKEHWVSIVMFVLTAILICVVMSFYPHFGDIDCPNCTSFNSTL